MIYKNDYSNMPNIYVTLANNIDNSTNIDNFLNEWRSIYDQSKPFNMIFDTIEVKPSLELFNHSFRIIKFIQELKEKPRLLRKSVIVVNSTIVKQVLNFVFQIQPPICDVFITEDTDYIQKKNISRKSSKSRDSLEIDDALCVKAMK